MEQNGITPIAQALFACAAKAGASEHKRLHFIDLPDIIFDLARSIAEGNYRPQAFTVFAVTDPKLREIFAPAFADRLAQQWLVQQIEPWWNKRFIDDSYANRKGKGTQAAVARVQGMMRQPGHRWYCKMDIRAFFPSIDRGLLLEIWQHALPKMKCSAVQRAQLDQVARAILAQSPVEPPPRMSGRRDLLLRIPPHKSLYHAPPGIGLPIGSLSSQFFANVYLNELDKYVKHQLKVRAYVRYVDDFVILAESPEVLVVHMRHISAFLQERLRLQLHPHKTVIQRANQGLDFLGNVIYPHHLLVRQRSVRALRQRIAWFKWLVFGAEHVRAVPPPAGGRWPAWLKNHTALIAPQTPSAALLQKMLACLNSYYGLFGHAQTRNLREHIYQHELGPLKRFFMPDGPHYRSLHIRAVWRDYTG